MKTRLTFLTTVLLALPLALSTPSRALAQLNKAQSQQLSDAQKEILNKLDSIRLDTVSYDLPLPEVIRNLMEEARKRDPEKKGINFMINPNRDLAPAPPGGMEPPGATEGVSINDVQVTIAPPLRDVRLVDALDAVVKVAHPPIKFSIEDYGVVFSLKGFEPPHQGEAGFAFSGGTPKLFLDAVEERYHVNWSSVADIPDQMRNVHIPALRIDQESIGPILNNAGPRQGRVAGVGGFGGLGGGFGGGGGAGIHSEQRPTPLEALVVLYNHLGEVKPELGRLVVEGDLAKPSVVMFIPGNMPEPPEIKVKAFPLKGIPEKDWDKLEKDIAEARDALPRTFADVGAPPLGRIGRIEIHRATSLIVATGSAPFIEMVESMVAAYHANAQAEAGIVGLLEHLKAETNSPPKQE